MYSIIKDLVVTSSIMYRTMSANGRSVEDFVGESTEGDLGEALSNAVAKARLTLDAPSIDWHLVSLSGRSTAKQSSVVAVIKAKSTST